MKILIIDDEFIHITLIQSKIEQEELGDVIVANSGEEGIELAKKERPDIIILDTILEGGMDGFKTCKEIRKIDKLYSKIVMITGKVDSIDVGYAMKCGVDDYCVKTSNYNNLITTIKNVINKVKCNFIEEKENIVKDTTINIPNPKDTKTILVVDDVLLNRILLREILELNNYKVLEADDGLNAIKVLQLKKDISLILLDLDMPRMDGFSFCEVVKTDKAYKDIPIILVTAEFNHKDVQVLHYDYYMKKPIEKNILIEKIKNLI